MEAPGAAEQAIHYLLDHNFLLTALELLHEAGEAGLGHDVERLQRFFRDPALFPPEAVAACNPENGAIFAQVAYERQQQLSQVQYDLAVAREQLSALRSTPQLQQQQREEALQTTATGVQQQQQQHVLSGAVDPPQICQLSPAQLAVLNRAVLAHLQARGFRLAALSFSKEAQLALPASSAPGAGADALSRFYAAAQQLESESARRRELESLSEQQGRQLAAMQRELEESRASEEAAAAELEFVLGKLGKLQHVEHQLATQQAQQAAQQAQQAAAGAAATTGVQDQQHQQQQLGQAAGGPIGFTSIGALGALVEVASCMPKILPNLLINKRDELIPVLMALCQEHPEAGPRRKLAGLLFGLIKKPNVAQRAMIVDACVRLSERIGAARTMLDLVPHLREQVKHELLERRLLVADAAGALAPLLPPAQAAPTALRLLEVLLLDTQPQVRCQALAALARLPAAQGRDTSSLPEVFRLLLATAADGSGDVSQQLLQSTLPAVLSWLGPSQLLLTHLLPQLLAELHRLLDHCPAVAGRPAEALLDGDDVALPRIVPANVQGQASTLLQMYIAALPAVRSYALDSQPPWVVQAVEAGASKLPCRAERAAGGQQPPVAVVQHQEQQQEQEQQRQRQHELGGANSAPLQRDAAPLEPSFSAVSAPSCSGGAALQRDRSAGCAELQPATLDPFRALLQQQLGSRVASPTVETAAAAAPSGADSTCGPAPSAPAPAAEACGDAGGSNGTGEHGSSSGGGSGRGVLPNPASTAAEADEPSGAGLAGGQQPSMPLAQPVQRSIPLLPPIVPPMQGPNPFLLPGTNPATPSGEAGQAGPLLPGEAAEECTGLGSAGSGMGAGEACGGRDTVLLQQPAASSQDPSIGSSAGFPGGQGGQLVSQQGSQLREAAAIAAWVEGVAGLEEWEALRYMAVCAVPALLKAARMVAPSNEAALLMQRFVAALKATCLAFGERFAAAAVAPQLQAAAGIPSWSSAALAAASAAANGAAETAGSGSSEALQALLASAGLLSAPATPVQRLAGVTCALPLLLAGVLPYAGGTAVAACLLRLCTDGGTRSGDIWALQHPRAFVAAVCSAAQVQLVQAQLVPAMWDLVASRQPGPRIAAALLAGAAAPALHKQQVTRQLLPLLATLGSDQDSAVCRASIAAASVVFGCLPGEEEVQEALFSNLDDVLIRGGHVAEMALLAVLAPAAPKATSQQLEWLLQRLLLMLAAMHQRGASGKTPAQLAEAAVTAFVALRQIEAHEFTDQRLFMHFAAALTALQREADLLDQAQRDALAAMIEDHEALAATLIGGGDNSNSNARSGSAPGSTGSGGSSGGAQQQAQHFVGLRSMLPGTRSGMLPLNATPALLAHRLAPQQAHHQQHEGGSQHAHGHYSLYGSDSPGMGGIAGSGCGGSRRSPLASLFAAGSLLSGDFDQPMSCFLGQ